MIKEQMQQVSFEQLWSELSGSTDFGQDELIEMLAYQDDQGEDFCIYHRNKAFCVPLHKIKEFFTRHKKPVPPMTEAEELKYLREKVKKLEAEAENFQAVKEGQKPAPEDDETKVYVAEEADTSGDSGQDTPVVEEKPVPPKRDESIPPPDQREKKSLKDIRADLAVELKDKKTPKKTMTDKAVPKDVKGREELVDNLVKKK